MTAPALEVPARRRDTRGRFTGCTDANPCAIHQRMWICGMTETKTRWRRTVSRHPKLRGKRVYVQCCNRNAVAEETVCRFETAYGGYVADWYFCCASRQGCNANPGYKRTAHLRYYE